MYHFKAEISKFYESNFEPLLSTFFFRIILYYCLPSYRPLNFCISRKDKPVKNRSESRSLVPNYLKIGQGNQWLRPISATSDFHKLYHMVRQTPLIALSPLRFPASNQGGSKNGRLTLKIFWEDWYAREISCFVCNKE